MTLGNKQKRYVGRLDESLCEEGKQMLIHKKGLFPKVDQIYISPMKRCIQTANILYPKIKRHRINELSECNFGIFEGKNYQELAFCSEYQQWIASDGLLPFPGGESIVQFSTRCHKAYQKILQLEEEHLEQTRERMIAVIAHGGTIMAVFSKFAYPMKGYYEWQIANASGILTEVRKTSLMVKRYIPE